MEDTTCFLSVESEEPIGVCVFYPHGFNHIPIKEFLNESLIDMSRDVRLKYAIAFRDFVKKLEAKE